MISYYNVQRISSVAYLAPFRPRNFLWFLLFCILTEKLPQCLNGNDVIIYDSEICTIALDNFHLSISLSHSLPLSLSDRSTKIHDDGRNFRWRSNFGNVTPLMSLAFSVVRRPPVDQHRTFTFTSLIRGNIKTWVQPTWVTQQHQNQMPEWVPTQLNFLIPTASREICVWLKTLTTLTWQQVIGHQMT